MALLLLLLLGNFEHEHEHDYERMMALPHMVYVDESFVQ